MFPFTTEVIDLSLTQGTVFSGLRSNKYSGENCYGVVITAQCDLANKKVDKVFFLTALCLTNLQ